MTQDTPARPAKPKTITAIRGPMHVRLLSGLAESAEVWEGDGTPHLLWTRSTNNKGYGQLAGDDGRAVLVHRAYWELTKGPIPEGRPVDHLCRVTRCVRHLEVVTTAENNRRAALVRGTIVPPPRKELNMKRVGRPRKEQCIRGHDMVAANVREYVTPTGHVQRTCLTCERIRKTPR